MSNRQNGRGKRKAWVCSKDAKIPRTTAWRSRKKETEIVESCTLSDSPITPLHNVDDFIESSIPMFQTCSGSEKDNLSTQLPTSSADDDNVTNALFCEEQFSEDPMGELISLLVDEHAVSDSETSEEESERDIELTSTSSDSENENETSDNVDDDFMKNDDEKNDDDVPLYEGANVSKLGALIVIMLFSLRHKLSGQALIDLVKVLRALLPDGHKFVTSAYLLKKYFADLFGEPAPKKHSYCGNCLGRIRWGQAECTKDKCRNAKKKIEHFLELDLHMRLCQLYRGKQRFYLFFSFFRTKKGCCFM